MDEAHFDALTRWITTRVSRRSLGHRLGAGVLSTLLTQLGLRPVTATHGCRHVNKPCSRSGQCCAGARCQNGVCHCKATHFKCGTLCCLDGALCLPVNFGGKVCLFGGIQPDHDCNPDQPGKCASGICERPAVGEPGICREADCVARGADCTGLFQCCKGDCQLTPCHATKVCCAGSGQACANSCDCCDPESVCQGGKCCQKAGGSCLGGECCGELVCESAQCIPLP